MCASGAHAHLQVLLKSLTFEGETKSSVPEKETSFSEDGPQTSDGDGRESQGPSLRRLMEKLMKFKHQLLSLARAPPELCLQFYIYISVFL